VFLLVLAYPGGPGQRAVKRLCVSAAHVVTGRMSECGEDLLVDLSEILFNELAFFRLMQNLDTTNTKVKERLRTFAKVAAVRSLQIL